MTNVQFKGNIVGSSNTDITMTNTILNGRALTTATAVTLTDTAITIP